MINWRLHPYHRYSVSLSARIFKARSELQARRGERVTQKALAKALGVSQPAVTDWEKGRSEPDLATIVRLAAFLEVAPSWLAFGDDASAEPVIPPFPVDSLTPVVLADPVETPRAGGRPDQKAKVGAKHTRPHRTGT